VDVLAVERGDEARVQSAQEVDGELVARPLEAPDILEVLRTGDPWDAAGLVTNQAPLESAPQLYEAFKRKENGVVKVVLRP